VAALSRGSRTSITGVTGVAVVIAVIRPLENVAMHAVEKDSDSESATQQSLFTPLADAPTASRQRQRNLFGADNGGSKRNFAGPMGKNTSVLAVLQAILEGLVKCHLPDDPPFVSVSEGKASL
jgi:hypothetical protein